MIVDSGGVLANDRNFEDIIELFNITLKIIHTLFTQTCLVKKAYCNYLSGSGEKSVKPKLRGIVQISKFLSPAV